MKQFKFNERQRFSIRKFSMGAASVLLGSVFFAVSSVEDVQAAEQSQNVVGVNENKQTPDPVILSNSSTTGVSTEETNTSVSATNVENKPEGDVVGSSKETLNKTALTKLIEDIDGKFTNGKYASKTEDSVNQLKTALDEANAVLNNAKTQEELTRAYNKLVTATTQLKTKPEEKKEAPAVDTTNGKATVGIKAPNTEKATETNSIAHSGSRDERNGKALNTNNPFRTDATTTNDDPSANQTYIAPAENADFATLTNKLKTLPNYIENNKKVQDMNTLGDEKGVTAGRVAEITEFGGWKAVSQEDGSAGKFAIARKTEKGVFPIETVNVVGPSKTAWLEEQSFNRDRNYMLFLSEVRTQATQNKESYNSQPYESNQKDSMGQIVSIGVKGYKGIEKRFKVYHSQDETKVNVQFKTGYSGLMEGDGQKSRAKYKVEVFSEVNGSESLVYSTEFDPGVNVDDAKKTVVAAVNGKPAKRSLRVTTAAAALEELSQDKYKPLGTGGTFTSKEITLPVGTNSYKVRISSANDRYLGMDYHSRFAQYALPITGLDFNINQDTGAIAKKLLSRIYDKLKATETADTDGKTNETKAAYLAELEKVKTLVTSTDVKKTAEYKEALESTLSKQLALRVDKTELERVVGEESTVKGNFEYYNADKTKRDAYDSAINNGNTVIKDPNATQSQVAAALKAITEAKQALDGTETNKDELQRLVNEAANKATDAKYYNAEQGKKDAYDQAITKAQEVLNKANVTQAEINAEKGKVETAKNALDGTETNKDELQRLVNEAANKATDAKYYNAEQGKKDAYDQAITKAQEVLNKANVTQAEINAEKGKVETAKNALDGTETNKDELQRLVNEAANKATDAKYYNAEQGKKDAYDQAITKAQEVLNKANVTQAEINAEKGKVETAKNALDGTETNKDELQRLVNEAANKATDAKYYNAEQGKKDAYDQAITKAQEVLNKANVTQAEINAEKGKVETAKNALDGTETNKDELQRLVNEAANKATDAKYYNAEQGKKDAYDQAITKAQEVLNKANVTQAEINAEKGKVETAKNALDGTETNKDELQRLVNEAANKATDAKYYNAEQGKKDAYDQAITKAQEVLNKANVTQAEINAEKGKVETAKNALDGTETNKDELQRLVNEAANKATDAKYYNAEQGKKDAYDQAITKAQEVLNKANVTQAEINAEKGKVETAKNALDGTETNKDELQRLVNEAANKATDAKYYNAEQGKKDAYDQAITKAQEVLNKANVTQAEINAEKGKVETAKNALDGTETNKDELQRLVNEAANKATDAKYYNAEQGKKDAYDQAITKAQEVLNKANVTQAEINAEKGKVETAKNALDGTETNKDELQRLVNEAANKATDAKYYNAEQGKKDAYDQAITKAQEVLNKANVTQAEINAEKGKVETAKNALDGTETNKDELQRLVNEAANKATDAKYYNAEQGKKDAYDQAITKAQEVLNKANVTQAEINAEKGKVETAKNALDGTETNKDELQRLVNEAANKATDAKYYNAEQGKKDAYDQAITKAQEVLNKANVTQAEINAEKGKVETAKNALDGTETNKDELQRLVNEAANKATDAKYYNAEQGKKDAYDQAITKAQEVLNKANVTQAEINAEKGKVETAKNALDGTETNKDELQRLVNEAANKATDAKYYNAEQGKKDAYDQAITKAQEVLNKANVTQAEINAEKGKVETAKNALDGTETNKDELQRLVNEAANKATDAKYYNAEQGKKDAYDQAITKAQEVLNKANVTQAEINAEKGKVETAKNALDGTETNKDELQRLVNEAANKATDAKYYNAEQGKKDAYDQAITKAQEVLNKANVTQAEINAEKGKVETAKNALDGTETNKDELQRLVNEAANKATDAKYYNAEQGKKDAYDQAITKAQEVLNKANVTQAEINAEKGKVETAKNALDGTETNKDELQRLVNEAANKATDAKYYNAEQGKKDAYDQAITKAQEVLNKANVTQAEINAEKGKVETAKNALDGTETNKDELQRLVNEAANKATDAKYYNAEQGKKDAYDQAITKAQEVLNKANVTQAEINAEKGKVETAKNALDGTETNKDELQRLVNEAANKATDAKYYNAEQGKKDAYDQAITKAQEVLNKANVTQAEINAEKGKVETAKNALDGTETNKDELQRLVNEAANKATDAKYYNAEQGKKDAYDQAITKAQEVLNKANVTQAEINAEKGKVETAKNALDGTETNKDELQRLVNEAANKATDAKYYNAEQGKKDAYDQAITKAQEVLNKANVTQAEINAEKGKVETAKNALDGTETNKDELQRLVNEAANKATDAKYYNAEQGKKDAYDQAITKAQEVLNKANVTQAEINAEKGKVETAKNALDGTETNKDELQRLVNEAANKATDAKYYNAEQGKKDAYDQAITKAQEVLNKANVTQAEINAEKGKVETAKNALDGTETNKDELQRLVNEAANKATDAKYYNAEQGKKDAYDQAITKAQEVLNKANVTQAEINAEKGKVETAKNALDGTETNKDELQRLVNEAANKATDAKYYNAEQGKKDAYDQAITKAQEVLNKANVTQAEINAEKGKVETAKNALDGTETNKDELQRLVNEAANKATDAKYYNAEQGKKDAYDQAITKAQEVLNKANVTQAEINAEKGKVETAKNALDGTETNKDELQRLVNEAANKATDAKYYNAEQGKKDAYDQAITKAQEVLNKANVTQAEINAEKGKVETAKNALDGTETNKDELQRLVNEAANKATDAKYYNAEQGKKDAYDQAITKAQEVLNKANVTQAEINAEKGKVETAKNALDGTETNKDELQRLVNEAANKATDAKYYNAEQGKKDAYDQAITKAQEVLNKANVTQAEINAEKGKVETAKNALDGTETNKDELQRLVNEAANKATDAKYYNAEQGKKDAYDQAITKAQEVLNKANVTQAEINAEKGKVETAKNALDGTETNKDELQRLVNEAANKATDAKYYNAEQGKKDAYDQAITKAQEVLNKANVTQAEINAEKGKVETAKNALDGTETNKDELQRLVNEAANKATDAKYYNAEQGKKDAYDQAITKAQEVLNKANVTQAEINAEKGKVETAKNALDGTETNKAQLTNNNNVLNELISEDPTNGKTKATIDEYKKVKEESEKLLKEIKKVIDNKNASQIEVNKALEMVVKAKDSLENAKKSLLDAVEAREVVETIANEKIASIKADKKLSVQEKEKAIDRVERLKEKALEEIDKSKKQTEIDKALRTFLYQMDQDSLVYERPSFDLEAFIQSSITGVVTVERGKAIRQADVIAKLNLPENVTVISIDLPDTNTLGDKFAKVTLRLADGKEITVKVPVRVVAPQNGDSKPDTSLPNHGANNGSTNTDAKVDKAKLEGAIRQLDELIIRESAKLDAETAKEANALSADAKKVFANADTSQAEVDAMIKRIEDFMAKVALSTDHATPTNDQAAQTPAVAPATTQAAVNAGQTASAQASVRTVAKELPNTGTVDSVVSMVVAAASALLGLGLASRRRKEDEEA